MRSEAINLYEQVFESWLREQKIAYKSVVQTQRIETPADSVKNFDFLLWPGSPAPMLVELKGRTFHGSSLAGRRGLDSWVTFEDVQALSYWLDAFSRKTPDARAVFVFLFRLEQIDIESDGLEIYEYQGGRFVMLSVALERYRRAMKQRSPKWQTVMLPADEFRRSAVPVTELFTDQHVTRKAKETAVG
jgi:hypothetical protein